MRGYGGAIEVGPPIEIASLDPITMHARKTLRDVTRLLVIADKSSDLEVRALAKKAVSFFLNPPMMIKPTSDPTKSV